MFPLLRFCSAAAIRVITITTIRSGGGADALLPELRLFNLLRVGAIDQNPPFLMHRHAIKTEKRK